MHKPRVAPAKNVKKQKPESLEDALRIGLRKALPKLVVEISDTLGGTYVLVALQRANTMLPLPLEGQRVRMPWTPAMLRDAKQVVVEYQRSGLAHSHPVPPVLIQYGTTLRLVDPKWYAMKSSPLLCISLTTLGRARRARCPRYAIP
jgi:hypothetical protein